MSKSLPSQIISRPQDDGFYLPAEWCRHARSWVAWPGTSDGLTTLDGTFKQAVANAVCAIREFEPITVLARAGDVTDIYNRCGRAVDIMEIEHESARIRDFGPTFLIDGKGGSAAVDWQFDGWNDRVENWTGDSKACHSVLGEAEIRRFRAPLTLEGSAFCSDGEGSVLALSKTALDPARNPSVSKLQAFDILSHWLGVKRVIWLDDNAGSGPDACDIRQACSFTSPGHVLVGEQENGRWSTALEAIADRLAQTDDAQGNRITVDRIPLLESQDLICAYTSFYVLNTAVLVPSYGCPDDDKAAEMIGSAFPGRVVRQVDASNLIAGGATLSSLIQYQPARLLERSKATLLPRSAWQRPVPDYVGLLETYIEKAESED